MQEEAKNFLNLGVVVKQVREVLYILFIRRVKKEKGENGVLEWAFPGGRQRLRETREECVKREVLTETGYKVEPIRQISIRKHPQFPVIIVYHLCKLASPKQVAAPAEPHEIAEIRWVTLKELKSLITSNLDPKVERELILLAKS